MITHIYVIDIIDDDPNCNGAFAYFKTLKSATLYAKELIDSNFCTKKNCLIRKVILND